MFDLGKKRKAGPTNIARAGQFCVDDFILDLAWSPDGEGLAAVTVEGQVLLARSPDVSIACQHVGSHARGATSVSWRADGMAFATSGQDGAIRIWDGLTGRPLSELPAGHDWCARVSYQPNGKLLASAAGRSLKLWSPEGKCAYESSEHSSTIADIGWNPEGEGVAVAAYNGVTLHVPGKLDKPRKLTWKGSSLVLRWSPTSRFIATGEQDSTVHFWYMKTGRDCQMSGFPTKVLQLAWHRSGELLATGGSDTVVIWDCSGKGPENREPQMLEGHSTQITDLAYQRRAEGLCSGDADGLLLIWNPAARKKPLFGFEHPSAITRVEWSHDDRYLAVGEKNGTITLFSCANGG